MSVYPMSIRSPNNTILWTDDFDFRSDRDYKHRTSPPKSLNTVQQFIADLKDPQDLFGAVRPLLLLSFMNGISPFKTVGSPGNRRLVTTPLGIANTCVLFAFFIISYVLRVVNQQSLVAHFFHSKITSFGEHLQILTSFVALAFTLLLCFLKRDKLRKLFHVLDEIDKKLSHLGASLNYKWISRIVMLAVFIAVLIYYIFIGATIYLMRSLKDQPDFYEWIFYFLPIGIVTTLKLQFYIMMLFIKYRLRCINLLLWSLQGGQMSLTPLECMDKNRIHRCYGIKCNPRRLHGGLASKREKFNIIVELCRTHEELCDACYLAEQYFSHQMLTAVAIEFVSTLFDLYFLADSVYSDASLTEIDKIEFVCYLAFCMALSLGTVYALLRSAEAVTAENEMCAIFVHKSLNVLDRHENDAREVLTRFSMQLLHRKIKFTALGLFPLDNTLIFTMIGAATTYLIIMFQVGHAIK